jgi:hypothetical protein
VEKPWLDESFIVTFELIAILFVPIEIIKKKKPLEFIIYGYEDLKSLFCIHGQPFLIDTNHKFNDHTELLGKWRLGPTITFFYLCNSL